MFKNLITIAEPKWAADVMVFLNDLMNKYSLLYKIVPLAADVFVFAYPVFLVALYIYAIAKKDHSKKIAALYIFFCAAISAGVNIVIQYFVNKDRPELMLKAKGNLVLEHLPTKSFPSDHAAVSAAIAVATLMIGYHKKSKFFIVLGWIFVGFSLIMSFCRIMAGVHWLTDVIAGLIIGSLVAVIFYDKKIFSWLQKNLFERVVRVEEKLLRFIFR